MAGLGTFADSFVMRFDASTMARVDRLMGAQATMRGYYMAAMRACAAQVARTAATPPYAPVLTGTLRRSIDFDVPNPMEAKVFVANVPYAARREYGFDNKTDALGRHFTLDPTDPGKRTHMMYLHRALDDNRPFIAATLRAAVMDGFKEMGR